MRNTNSHIIFRMTCRLFRLLGLFLIVGIAASMQGICQVTIMPNSGLVVTGNSSLQVDGDFTIESNASGTGAFVQNQNGTVHVDGVIRVKQYMVADQWHNVASPISNANASTVFPANTHLFYYNETLVQNDWDFGWVIQDGMMQKLRGYDAFIPDANLVVQYQTSGNGIMNTSWDSPSNDWDTIPVSITSNPDGEPAARIGWNLVGNPYPCTIDWLSPTGWYKNAIADEFYVWNPEHQTYATFVGGAAPVGQNGGTRFIAPMQGFWVKANSNSFLRINNSARVINNGSSTPFFKGQETVPTICLSATGNQLEDESIIRFIHGASHQFDIGYDANKLLANKGNCPQISSQSADGKACAINTYGELEDNLRIPVNFSCAKGGAYSINLKEYDGFQGDMQAWLYDKKEKVFINLLEKESYIFNHDSWTEPNRFILLFNPNESTKIAMEKGSGVYIYSNKNRLYVRKAADVDTDGIVEVYDVSGHLVFRDRVLDQELNSYTLQLLQGNYIVRVYASQSTSAAKVYIH